jgi:imidazole glycerol-phosphate synthase subunit HisH
MSSGSGPSEGRSGPAPTIAVVDYGMGNRRSVQKALEHVGATALITRDRDEISSADGLVVPGVGAFPLAMENLRSLGLADVIRGRAADGVPVLGICLGMQLLFEGSDELGGSEGLGLLRGGVTRLEADDLTIPHIGWNEVSFQRRSWLIDGLPAGGCPFYHVHSLAARPADDADVVGTSEYGERFATLVERGSIAGVQFHPEKSSAHGLRLLTNFIRACERRAEAVVAVARA